MRNKNQKSLEAAKTKYIVGIDEVGRGPVAGPVAVGAVLVEKKDQERVKEELSLIKDSKKLSEKKREEFFEKIKSLKDRQILFASVVFLSAAEIDRRGISFCLSSCVKEALENIFSQGPFLEKESQILLDAGLKAPRKFKNQESLTRGDEKELLIAAASIIAKVLRDRKMVEYARRYPEYDFDKNKGYGTKYHMEKIKEIGICPIHRKSFLKNYLK